MQFSLLKFADPLFLSGTAVGFVLGLMYYRLFPKVTEESDDGYDSDEEGSEASDIVEDESYKMVLVVRNDLKMGKGKAAAQCAHAAVAAVGLAKKNARHALSEWKNCGQAKVVVKVDNEADLLQVAKEAQKAGLVNYVIRDAGRTQIAPNSKTVLAIGPGPESIINQVTGHLKLY